MSRTRGRWLAAALVLAVVAAWCALSQVEPGFVRKAASLGLERPEEWALDPGVLASGTLGRMRWNAAEPLEARFGPVSAGDTLKLKLRLDPHVGPRRVAIFLDGQRAGEIGIDDTWRQQVLQTPVGGRVLRLELSGGSPLTVHVSRISATNVLRFSEGLLNLYLLPATSPLPAAAGRPAAWLATMATPALLFLLVAWRRRTGVGDGPTALRGAVLELLPGAGTLAVGGLVHLAGGARLVCLPGSFALILALPAVTAEAIRLRRRVGAALIALLRAAQATARRAGSSPLVRSPSVWLAVMVTVYAALLLWLRPATPFEWDEVLYQRGLDHYDVAAHSPHPPGAPMYIAAGHVVRWLVGDPQLALQLVAVIFSVGGLVTLFFLVRRLGASTAPALGAVVVCAAVPAFFFHGDTGLSDAPGAYAALAAALAFLVAAQRPRALPLAALAAAFALGIRPQNALALAPAAVVALTSTVRQRKWRSLRSGLAVGLAGCLAIWVPAVLITGWSRYRAAIAFMSNWLVTRDGLPNFPHPTVALVVRYWLLDPLGGTWTGWTFWGLAALGAVVWWRQGRRKLVALCLASSLLYLAFGVYRLQMRQSVRYALPALPWLVLLASGVLASRVRWRRMVGVAALAAWSVAAFAWGWPAYVQRRDPAPVWAALTWVRDHFDPERTAVAFEGGFRPHATYVLGKAGFQATPYEAAKLASAVPVPGKETVIVATRPIPGAPVLFHKVWHAPRVLQLAFYRYDECTVMLSPLGRATAPARSLLFLPGAPLATGGHGRWKTDVSVTNLLDRPLRLEAIFLPSGRDNSRAPARQLTLEPGQRLEALDVWSARDLQALAPTGAIVLRNLDDDGRGSAPEPWLAASAQTRGSGAAATSGSVERCPAYAFGAALHPGQVARFPDLTHDDRSQVGIGLASLTPVSVTATVRIVVAGVGVIGEHVLHVPAFGDEQILLPQRFSHASVELSIGSSDPGAAVFPYASEVDAFTGVPSGRAPVGLDRGSDGGVTRVPLPAAVLPPAQASPAPVG